MWNILSILMQPATNLFLECEKFKALHHYLTGFIYQAAVFSPLEILNNFRTQSDRGTIRL